MLKKGQLGNALKLGEEFLAYRLQSRMLMAAGMRGRRMHSLSKYEKSGNRESVERKIKGSRKSKESKEGKTKGSTHKENMESKIKGSAHKENIRDIKGSTQCKSKGNTQGNIKESTQSKENIRNIKESTQCKIKENIQKNAVGIQRLSDELYKQVFPDIYSSRKGRKDTTDPKLVELARKYLKDNELLGKKCSENEPIRFRLPKLQGRNLEEHFQRLGAASCGRYVVLAERLLRVGNDPPARPGGGSGGGPGSATGSTPGTPWVLRGGWTRYCPGRPPEHVDYPVEDELVFDVEVMYRVSHYPVLATCMSPVAWYGWCSPYLAGESDKIDGHLIPLGVDRREKIVVGHNVSYDRARVREEYSLGASRAFYLDTMSLHVAVSGMCSRQRGKWIQYRKRMEGGEESRGQLEDLREGAHTGGLRRLLANPVLEEEEENSTGTGKKMTISLADDPWLRMSSMNSLRHVARFHCGIRMDKAAREEFETTDIGRIRVRFQQLMDYCAADVEATYRVFGKVFPAFRRIVPHDVSLAALRIIGQSVLPVSRRWNDYVRTAEALYQQSFRSIGVRLAQLCEEVVALKDKAAARPWEGDPWLSQLDWTIVPPRLTKAGRPYKRQKLPGYPAWYKKLVTGGRLHITTRTRIAPLLLRLSWEGCPVFWTDTRGWCFWVPRAQIAKFKAKNYLPVDIAALLHEEPGLRPHICPLVPGHCLFKVPHESGPTARTTSLMSKPFMRYFQQGVLSSKFQVAKDALQLAVSNSYWVSSRERIMDQFVVFDDEGVADIIGGGAADEVGLSVNATNSINDVADKAGSSINANMVNANAVNVNTLNANTVNLNTVKANTVKANTVNPNTLNPNTLNPNTLNPNTVDQATLPNSLDLANKLDHANGVDPVSMGLKAVPTAAGNNAATNANLVGSADNAKSVDAPNEKKVVTENEKKVATENKKKIITGNKTKANIGIPPLHTFTNPPGTDIDTVGLIIPQVIPMGTITRRAVEKTWLTASNAKPTRLGSELKAMVRAPPGYCFVGADVDSEELWIASLMGDSVLKIHGGTALGWMTLEGNKAMGTDLHSKTAKILGISRGDAKIFNYGRIYGAGVSFATTLLKKFNPAMGEQEAVRTAHRLYAATKGRAGGVAGDRVWHGGSESVVFNRLEQIAQQDEPRTPVLGAGITAALKRKFLNANTFMPSRVNWAIQSSGVDYLHLILTSVEYLCRVYGVPARLCLTVHDEARYLTPLRHRYRLAMVLQIANLWTRAMFCHQAGIDDVPQTCAFFSAVDIDRVIRKEVNMDCITPSNSHPIPHGESLDIYQLLARDDVRRMLANPHSPDLSSIPVPPPQPRPLQQLDRHLDPGTRRLYVSMQTARDESHFAAYRRKYLRNLKLQDAGRFGVSGGKYPGGNSGEISGGKYSGKKYSGGNSKGISSKGISSNHNYSNHNYSNHIHPKSSPLSYIPPPFNSGITSFLTAQDRREIIPDTPPPPRVYQRR